MLEWGMDWIKTGWIVIWIRSVLDCEKSKRTWSCRPPTQESSQALGLLQVCPSGDNWSTSQNTLSNTHLCTSKILWLYHYHLPGVYPTMFNLSGLVYLGNVPAFPLPAVDQVHHVQVRTARGAPRWLPFKSVIFQMLPPIQHIWLFSPLFLISFLFHERWRCAADGTWSDFQIHLILGMTNACAMCMVLVTTKSLLPIARENFPDYLIERLLRWKQRNPLKVKHFIVNIISSRVSQSCKHRHCSLESWSRCPLPWERWWRTGAWWVHLSLTGVKFFKDTSLILNSEPQEDSSSQVSKEVGRIHLACRELPHLKEDIIRW